MDAITLREVVEDWLESLDVEATTENRKRKLALLAELEKAEAAVSLAEWFVGPMQPSEGTRMDKRAGSRLSCRYWDAKQAAARFQSNQ